jgi:3-deoxy-D-manno-octulosonic-acid transferase
MIVYRALQPLLLALYGALACLLRWMPGLREKTRKFWTTWDIRYVDGVPAFLKIDKSLFANERPIWIHAASGEFEYAKPVIRKIREKSAVPILVTYFSPTYAENVRKFPGVTASAPLPLDSRDELESFIQYLQPKALLIARTDAWPNTVTAARQHEIPTLLFSATFHEQSKRMGSLARHLTRETLKLLSLIQCVSESDLKTLGSLGLTQTVVAGDSRYDQVLERLATPPPSTVKGLLTSIGKSIQDRALVAGSVWREDLGPVLAASRQTQSETPHTLILVPHEISENFLREIETNCSQAGVVTKKIARLSRLNASKSTAEKLEVLIVDSVGLLAELYRLGDIAFVGGSFKKSVHSVMEPLAAGCLTIVGPYHLNNREALEFQSEPSGASTLKYVTSVRDAAEFATTLSTAWNQVKTSDAKLSIREQVAKRGGATAHVVRWLSDHKLI